jgi:hypothetical protein
MNSPRARAIALVSSAALAALVLTACGGSSSAESTSAPAASPSAVASDLASEGIDDNTGSTATYCGPLADAYAIKPPSGSAVSDEELQAFADALEPAAVAAQADGRQDLYDLFALVARMNAEPDAMTSDEVNEAFTQIDALGPEVLADCGIDLMS